MLLLHVPEFLLEESEGEDVVEVVGCSIARGSVGGDLVQQSVGQIGWRMIWRLGGLR